MPSFGSKSDIDLLFASVQQQIVPPLIEQTLGAAEPKAKNARNHTDHATEGNISRKFRNDPKLPDCTDLLLQRMTRHVPLPFMTGLSVDLPVPNP